MDDSDRLAALEREVALLREALEAQRDVAAPWNRPAQMTPCSTDTMCAPCKFRLWRGQPVTCNCVLAGPKVTCNS